MESTTVIFPYIWLIAGVGLVLFEFLTPGFIVIFFGVGALITAITTWMGLTVGLTSQILCFGISSVLLLFGLRRYVKAVFLGRSADGSGDQDDDFTGREAQVTQDIPGGHADGRIEIKGSEWNARASDPVPAGSTIIIESRDGFTFHVRKL